MHILKKIYQSLVDGQEVVVATIISDSGSTPRTSGSKMLIFSDGRILGTIGGGAVEGDVIQTGLGVFFNKGSVIKAYNLNNTFSETEMDLICGGQMEVLIEYVPTDSDQAAQYLQSHLYQAIVSANEEVFIYAKERNIRMASTVTCALIYDSLAVIANIGDSRTYLFRDQQLNKITTDHSVVDWLVRQGHLTPEEAANHPYKNVIMHALGSHETPETDLFLQTVQVNDILLLCSDGIWDTLSDDKLERMLIEADSLETAVSQLAKAAQDNTDDLSLIITEIIA